MFPPTNVSGLHENIILFFEINRWFLQFIHQTHTCGTGSVFFGLSQNKGARSDFCPLRSGASLLELFQPFFFLSFLCSPPSLFCVAPFFLCLDVGQHWFWTSSGCRHRLWHCLHVGLLGCRRKVPEGHGCLPLIFTSLDLRQHWRISFRFHFRLWHCLHAARLSKRG